MKEKEARPEEKSHRFHFSEWYGRFLLGHRKAFAILAGLLSIVALTGLTKLRFDDEPREIFKQSDEDFALLEEYFEQFGADDNNIILVLHGNLFTPEFSRALRGFVNEARKSSSVVSVLSILDVPGPGNSTLLPPPEADPVLFEEAKSVALDHPFATGHLVSASGATILVTLELVEDGPQTISKIRPIYEELQLLKNRWFEGLPFGASFAGSVAVRVETLSGVRNEFFQITALGALIAMLVAFVLFRSPATTLIVSAGPGLAVFWTLGLMGWLGMNIEGISTPLPAIVFVVAFANSVHLMIDIRRSRRLGQSAPEASRNADAHLGMACMLTSLTTTIGFASLIMAETDSVQRFGLATAAGSVLGLLSNLTVVPLLASTMNRPARRPPEKRPRKDQPQGLLVALARLITALSLPLTLLALGLTAILVWSATQLKSDIVWTETLPSDSEVTRAMNRADQEFGGIMRVPIIVTWDRSTSLGSPRMLKLLDELETLIEANPTFGPSLSILNFLPENIRSLPPPAIEQATSLIPGEVSQRLLRTDLRRTIITLRLPNTGVAATRPALRQLQKDLASLKARYPEFSLHVTGSAVIAAENMSNVIRDLVRSLSFASITVFLVLTIALRSLTLGLLSIIPNAFPLLFNAGLLYHLDKPLQISSVLTFSICLGIAVDDTIHFLIRFLRERREGADVRLALMRSFETVGLALLITTAVVSSAFLAAMTSSMPGIAFFGALACSAMIAALVGDLVFLPALLDRFVGKAERTEQRNKRRKRGMKL